MFRKESNWPALEKSSCL